MTLTRPTSLMAALLVAITAHAAPTPKLEEVVVTAQKRAESLQDVAISIAVVSGAELAALNKTQIADLSRLVPGFTFSEGTSDAGRNILIRGIGTNSFSRSVDLSVGTVVDNVASGSLSGSVLDFSDVERVEVLRGPQGMLFGKNSSAGLLNITTHAPTPELATGFRTSYGSNNLVNLYGYASGPLVEDSLLGRISLYSNTMDPIIDNEYPGGDDFNDRDEWGGRGKLRWLLSDDLDAQLAYTHIKRDHTCCAAALRQVTAGSIAAREGGPVGPKNDKVKDNDTSKGETKVDIYSLELNYSLDDFMLTSISAYTNENVYGAARADDYTRTALPLNDSFEKYEQYTQELRLTSPAEGKITYVAGLYYFYKKVDRSFYRYIDLYGIDQGTSGALSVTNESKTDSESFAGFGQATWNITDRSRISLGARYNFDQLGHQQTVGSFPGTLPEAPPGTVDQKTNDDAGSWRVMVEHDIAADAMVYASYAKGYKGPGSNSLPSGPTSGEVFVDPEIPSSYEVGIKSQWWDNRLRVNAAAYYSTFKDFQASAQVAGAFPPIFFLTNAGELETKGVELEVNAQLTDNFAVQGSLAYTDAIFSDWPDAPCYSRQPAGENECNSGTQDLSGARMPNSPKWSTYLAGTYYVPIPSMPFDGFASLNFFYRDEVQFDTANNPLFIGDPYDTFDLYTGISARDGRYRVQFYVQNLFDQFYVATLAGQEVVGVEAAQILPYTYKRRFGVSVQMDW
ncbi:MAG: TonB-dependent receptor [Halioglobus sp.]|nr:TonB-dependent receptor [Halioglobus sp.]